MSYPTNTSGKDVWSLRDVYKAEAGNSWPFPPPTAPTTVTAAALDAEATVTFSGQVTYGDSPTFTVTSSPDGITATGSSPVTVTGLTNDTEYTFTVTVTDDGGTATSSASNAVTPFGYYTSPTDMYNAGLPNGTYTMRFSSYQTTGDIDVNYASYDGRGWIEVLFSADGVATTPWDHWLTKTNGGPTNSTDFSGVYGLKNYGQSNNSIATYPEDSGVMVLGNAFNATDFAITSKSAKTVINVNATGQNQNNALPLTGADLVGTEASQTKQALIDYFLGLRAGFNAENSTSASYDFDGAFEKSGEGPFDIVLAYRTGASSDDEWHLADGSVQTNTTYSSNIGYRVRTDYQGNHVGSWTSGSAIKSSSYDISSSNVLSIWLTDG